jgi:GT2 family glycosyltransferase
MNKKADAAIVVVTHNSEKVISRCLEAISLQSVRPGKVFVVDSGSVDAAYVREALQALVLAEIPHELICSEENIGFAAANNLAVRGRLDDFRYWLFLNPDAFLFRDALEKALSMMGRRESHDVGLIGGWLLGYDLDEAAESGRIDSLGIGQNYWGRWYDIAQGQAMDMAKVTAAQTNVKAICGALMFVRSEAIESLGARSEAPFNESYFMYKEDIELSFRITRAGWKLKVLPEFRAYHCRGWQSDRSAMNHRLRLLSAVNEIKLNLWLKSPFIIMSLLKYCYVRCIER